MVEGETKGLDAWPSAAEHDFLRDNFTTANREQFNQFLDNEELFKEWSEKEKAVAALLLTCFFFGVHMVYRRWRFKDQDYSLLWLKNSPDNKIFNYIVNEAYPQGAYACNPKLLRELSSLFLSLLESRQYASVDKLRNLFEIIGIEEAAHYCFFNQRGSFGRSSSFTGDERLDYFSEIERNGLAWRISYVRRFFPEFIAEFKKDARDLISIPLKSD